MIWLSSVFNSPLAAFNPRIGPENRVRCHPVIIVNRFPPRRLVLLAALVFALAGCSDHHPFPWSLEGKAVPDYNIVDRDNLSSDGSVNFSLTAVVPASITKEQLTLVSERIIEKLPKHNLAIIFFYSDSKDVRNPYTVGKAWWGVSDNTMPRPGDYSHNTLKIDFGPATGATSPDPLTDIKVLKM